MPDVGILNLQIHDDSAKAAEGLSKLVAKLEEMKNATSKIRLGTVATGLKKINEALAKIDTSTVDKLNAITNALEKLSNAAGNVGGIKINFGGGKSQNLETLASHAQAAREAATQATSGFEDLKNSVQEISAQDTAIARSTEDIQKANEQLDFSKFDPSKLPLNALGMQISDTAKEMYKWGDAVKDSFESVQQMKSSELLNRFRENEAAMKASNSAMQDFGASTNEAAEGFESIAKRMQETAEGSQSFAQTSEAVDEVRESFERTTSAVQEAADGIKGYSGYYASLEDAFNGVRHGQRNENDLMSKWLHGEGTENEKLYAIKTMATQFGMSTDDVRAKIAELMAAENGLTGAAQETTDAMNSINGAADEQKKSLKELIIGANGLSGAFKRMFPTLSGLLGRFSQLVKYRMLRAVIKQIAEGFREGSENYYRYSQAIGGEFATKMDNAATALLQMKNSIGAAAAPLISSLIPYLQMAVDWFINIVNYANQFVALLRGQTTWSRAVPKTTKAFEDQTKAAKKAGAAVKDLLADWDELNIIQSESGGGSGVAGTSAAEDYLNMFEEVNRFDNGVSKVVEHIKENMDDIARMAAIAGAAILGWKVSDAFGGILGKLGGTLGTLATVALTVELTDQFGKLYTKTGDVGWLIADALTGAVGATIAGTMAKKIAGGQAGLATAGATLTISGLVNIQNAIGAAAQGMRSKWQMLTLLGSVESGVGAALIAKGIGLKTAFSFGMGTLAAIGAVAISVGALIQMSKDEIEWGEVTLTKEEVESFVSERMFNGLNVTATIDKINADLDNVQIDKQAIQDSLAAVQIPLNMIRLGINKQESYNELKKQLFGDEESGTKGLISKIQSYAESNVQELKTAFSVVPVIDKSGKDVSGQYIASGIQGWGEVQSYVNWLGGELGKELSKGFTEDGIAKFDEEAVKAMMEKIRKISEIVTGSQVQAGAQSDLRMGLAELGLGDLDQSSVNQVIELFGGYQSQLREAYEKIYKDAASQYLVLSNYYREQGNTELADDYARQYKELIEMLPKSVNSAVRSASAPGMEMVYEFLHDKFGDVFNKLALNLDDGGSGALRQALLAQFKPTDGDIQRTVQDFNKAMMSIYGGENMFLSGLLAQMPDINILDLLTYGMDEQAVNEAKANIKEMLTGLYGDDVANVIIDAWEKSHITEEVKEAAESMPTVEAEQEAMQTELPVEIKPVPEIVGTETTESFDFDAEAGVVDVPVEFSISTEGQQALRDAIESAMSDGVMTSMEEMDLSIAFGRDNYDQMLKELQYNLDEEGRNKGMMNRPIGMIASAGVSDVGSGRFDLYRPVVTPEPEDDQKQVNNTATGVQKGVSGLYDALQSILRVAEAINRKEFKVNVTPSASWGNHNSKSNSAWDRVTGNA